MNKVILMGRLTRDPEVRYSQGERSMAMPDIRWRWTAGEVKTTATDSRPLISSTVSPLIKGASLRRSISARA